MTPSETNERARNRTAFVIGTLSAVAINYGIESMDVFAPDALDMVYGVGAGALAASMVKVEPSQGEDGQGTGGPQ